MLYYQCNRLSAFVLCSRLLSALRVFAPMAAGGVKWEVRSEHHQLHLLDICSLWKANIWSNLILRCGKAFDWVTWEMCVRGNRETRCLWMKIKTMVYKITEKHLRRLNTYSFKKPETVQSSGAPYRIFCLHFPVILAGLWSSTISSTHHTHEDLTQNIENIREELCWETYSRRAKLSII